jgi:hypothetical protein
MVVQTDNYVEDLRYKNVKKERFAQTEVLLDYPQPPLPALMLDRAYRSDQSTLIGEDDLFDFNLEVEPVLHTLVTKNIEQALMEVLEEEELKEMAGHTDSYQQIRSVQLSELQRLTNKDMRHVYERQRRMRQERERLEAADEVTRKKLAALAAKAAFEHMFTESLLALRNKGAFHDPVESFVRQQYTEAISRQAQSRAHDFQAVSVQVDVLLRGALERARSESKEATERIQKMLDVLESEPPQKPHYFFRGIKEKQAQEEKETYDALKKEATEKYSRARPIRVTAARLEAEHTRRRELQQFPVNPLFERLEREKAAAEAEEKRRIELAVSRLIVCQAVGRAYLAKKRLKKMRALALEGWDVASLRAVDLKRLDLTQAPHKLLGEMFAMWAARVTATADPAATPGVIVYKIFAQSPLAHASIVVGDRITAVGETPITAPQQFYDSSKYPHLVVSLPSQLIIIFFNKM